MSARKYQLRKLLPSLVLEARSITDSEQKWRWKKLRRIVESPRAVALKCIDENVSESWFYKWADRVIKVKSIEALKPKSRRPKRCPHQTPKRVVKRIKKLRNAEPYSGSDVISHDLKKLYNMSCPPSTVYSVLKRENLISKPHSVRQTKKHIKRYRRDQLGYLQLDFKYVPYAINEEQCYQLSCVDHASSWRMIRGYRYKGLTQVLEFLNELKEERPFPIIQIQTDNDAAFTDKFWSGLGVTGEHGFDLWCAQEGVEHRLIPVGQKELNGKVENTHKQDDREFYSQVHCMSYASLELNLKGYEHRWNHSRPTKALGWSTPEQVIWTHYVAKLAWLSLLGPTPAESILQLDHDGNTYLKAHGKTKRRKKQAHSASPKTRTPKKTAIDRIIERLDWLDKKSS